MIHGRRIHFFVRLILLALDSPERQSMFGLRGKRYCATCVWGPARHHHLGVLCTGAEAVADGVEFIAGDDGDLEQNFQPDKRCTIRNGAADDLKITLIDDANSA